MISLRVVSFVVVVAGHSAWSAACTVTNGTTESDGGAVAADGAPLPEGDGGVLADGALADGASGVPTDYGSVSVTYADFGTTKSLTGFAQFQKLVTAPTLPTCQQEVEGDCTLYLCAAAPPVEAGAQDAGATNPHSGVITLSGARIPAGTTLTPGANGKYPTLSETGVDAWSGGETLTVKSAGGEVPAFSGTLTAPAPTVTLTAPVMAPPQKTEIDRSRALAVTWSGAGAGTIVVSASALGGGGGSASVSCRFDATKGSGQIPTKLLAKLPAGDGAFGASISTTSQVKAADYVVTLLASSIVKNAAGQVTLK